MFVNLKTGDPAFLLSHNEGGVYFSPQHIEENGNVYLLGSYEFFATHREATREEIEAGEPAALKHGRRQLAPPPGELIVFDDDEGDEAAGAGHRFAERGGRDDDGPARSTPPPNAATGARTTGAETPPASAAPAPNEPSKGAGASSDHKANNGKK